ncbi:N/A [soil metagenome]
MPNPRLKLERAFETLRHVPPRQLLRRLELIGRRRLAAWLPGGTGSAATGTVSDRAPLPLFPPRRMLRTGTNGWCFEQPWGSLDLALPIDWGLAASDPKALSWRTTLGYMEFLESADDRGFVEIVSAWIENNPPHRKNAWRFGWAPYSLSIRTVVWMQQIALRRARLDDAFLARAVGSLTAQLHFLERHLETDVRGNHLIRNIKALLWAGVFFQGNEARRWRGRGQALLETEIATQILEDGCHFERSPSYHCQVMGDLLEILSLLDAGPLRDRLAAALGRMAWACSVLTHPDGKVALFNDGGLDLAYAPEVLLDALERLGIARPERRAGPFALADAGFFGLIKDDEHLVVDCGPIGPDALIAHAHGDILSFEWSAGGRRLVVDQGTYQYPAGPRRRQSRAAVAHNTVVVDGMEPSDFFGDFRCGRRARPEVLDYRPSTEGFVLTGTHDGFRGLEGRPRHVRRIEAVPGRICIEDRIESAGQHEATAGILLHPDCRVDVAGREVRVENGPVKMVIESSIDPSVEPAEWFPNLYVSRPTLRLCYRWVAPGEVMRLVLRSWR